jgi:hypothetical protein
MTAAVMSAFSSEGFHYVGRTSLAKRTGAAERAAATAAKESTTAKPKPAPKAAADELVAYRYTPEGHVYVAK